MHVCMYVCVCMCVCGYVRMYVCTYVCVRMYVCMYLFIWLFDYLFIWIFVHLYVFVYNPVVPARGGAEAALGLHSRTFLTYRTCMRHAPARPVRACFVRSCCRVVVQEDDLSDEFSMQRQANLFFRLHTALSTPRTSHLTFRTSHSTLHPVSNHESPSHLISALLISSHHFSHVI